MRNLKDRTMFITGASRGIGLAIALRAARDGANIVIAAKTTEPQPTLPGTIYTAAEQIEAAGGNALPLAADIRHEAQVQDAVEQGVSQFGGIDILVNNASAIGLAGTLETPIKRLDLMLDINIRGTFVCSQLCIPHLLKAENPHILNLSPPLNMKAAWFKDHLGYTIAKYGMSMCVLGMAEEFRATGLAVNALWPRTVIDTAALRQLGDRVKPENCRKPEIVADAAYWILTQDSKRCTGRFFIDDEVLTAAGVTDLNPYAVKPRAPLLRDLFLD